MLSKLWINSGPTEEEVLRFLLEVPSVIDLAIGPEPFDRCPHKLLHALTLGSRRGPDGADLLPNLEHLKIHGGWHEREEMVQAIESRLGGVGDIAEGRRLKKVTLSSGVMIDHGYGSRTAQEKLDEYVRQGLICAE
ncbi:hypothetical protein FIBSPDRAFT_857705 [Athelia psychrophila]|uniref:Uncharacterized protein n=1 Tax=Athelia psychrophila TaxID=1759441 RepID=A0A166MFI8_9AGAM|nr:hypothetical protein FIBSPDRAFT_857705 [Fibularhizoctonia sp. CBS 109695]